MNHDNQTPTQYNPAWLAFEDVKIEVLYCSWLQSTNDKSSESEVKVIVLDAIMLIILAIMLLTSDLHPYLT